HRSPALQRLLRGGAREPEEPGRPAREAPRGGLHGRCRRADPRAHRALDRRALAGGDRARHHRGDRGRPEAPRGRAGVTASPGRPRVVGLVLAAGSARRMGGVQKLLALVDGAPMVARVAATLAQAGLAEVLVVVGPDADAVRGALAGVRARVVPNPEHASGLASSIRAGLAALGADV